jgi:membrane protease YdiL (CAAX protease family)
MIANSFQRHPLTWFFALAFGISWGGILVIASARGFDLSPLQPAEGGPIFLMMLLGPSLSGLICTAYTDGRSGLRALLRSALRWRVPAQWLAVALLTTPAILLTILLPLAMVAGPAFRPGLQWPLLAVGLVAGSFEEIGWTGFATPRLLDRLGLGRAGLRLGLVWAFWHLLVDVRFNAGAMGPLWPVEFVVVYLATLTPYRTLMTVVFARTRSLFAAILMHASFTGWLLVLFPATSVPQSLAWQAVFALILWALVVGVACKTGEPCPDKGLLR